MLLDRVVRASTDVGSTRSRKKKQAFLAELLRELAPDEVEVAVGYLSGVLPQGRIGLGWATFRDLGPGEPAAEPRLGLLETHRTFDDLATVTGKGSTQRRKEVLGALFAPLLASFAVKLGTRLQRPA